MITALKALRHGAIYILASSECVEWKNPLLEYILYDYRRVFRWH